MSWKESEKKKNIQCKHLEINLVIILGGFGFATAAKKDCSFASVQTNVAGEVCCMNGEMARPERGSKCMTDEIIDKPEEKKKSLLSSHEPTERASVCVRSFGQETSREIAL